VKDYIVVEASEALDENGIIKAGYEKRAYCYVKLVPISPTYQELRRREYPPMADYLDGVVKGDQVQIDEYIAKCLTVKTKYPKAE
jgi:hypothetical protein